MSQMKFSKEHEWVRIDGDTATIGITDYAQGQLGDVVYVELPEIGRQVEQDKEAAVVESVKAASEVFSPLSGEVVEVNASLGDEPGTVNTAPTGDGWFFKLKVKDPKELDALMDEAAYQKYVGELG
jgi:glycine cleavage system H protein